MEEESGRNGKGRRAEKLEKGVGKSCEQWSPFFFSEMSLGTAGKANRESFCGETAVKKRRETTGKLLRGRAIGDKLHVWLTLRPCPPRIKMATRSAFYETDRREKQSGRGKVRNWNFKLVVLRRETPRAFPFVYF